jgi:alkanesulfonate monooxygenase SsuD/methylene tetrahydromethanopterin reductase-like flavin-dependent oxidoreductase (luciferase family)
LARESSTRESTGLDDAIRARVALQLCTSKREKRSDVIATTPSPLRFGTLADAELLNGPLERRRKLAERAAQSGIDHLFVADHVSFHTGFGMDGLIQAALVSGLDTRLALYVGVYLLALRHPAPVARQLATLSESAPGRLVLGVGVGGEDRHEFEICGVDPRTRGRRTDECLDALRGLLSGEPTSFDGEFIQFEDALILPTPTPAIPIVIGGRSDAALERVARVGDGWLAAWCSPRRYAAALEDIAARADRIGRSPLPTRHGLQVWVGLDADPETARTRLAATMHDMYRIPFEPFERYSPTGTAATVAEALLPYVEAGCRDFNVMAVAASTEAAIDGVAEIRERILSSVGS